mgnify:CR=1 FL=1
MRTVVMQEIRTKVDAGLLATVIALPKSYLGNMLDVTVRVNNKEDDDIVNKLCGIASNLNMTSDEIRSERLVDKYEAVH